MQQSKLPKTIDYLFYFIFVKRSGKLFIYIIFLKKERKLTIHLDPYVDHIFRWMGCTVGLEICVVKGVGGMECGGLALGFLAYLYPQNSTFGLRQCERRVPK